MEKAMIERDIKTTAKRHRDTYCAKEVVEDTYHQIDKATADPERYREQRSCSLEGVPSEVPPHLRLIKFQHWVVFRRAHDQSIFQLERQRCPLLWCRKRFDDPPGLLSHIHDCEHLASGLYWCPHCCHAETFLKPVARIGGSFRKSGSCIWKIAFEFINELGLGARHKASGFPTLIKSKNDRLKMSKSRVRLKSRQKRQRSTTEFAELMTTNSRSEMGGSNPYKFFSPHTFKDEQMKMAGSHTLQQLRAHESYEHESNRTIAELMGDEVPRAELRSPVLGRPTSCQRSWSSTLGIPGLNSELYKRDSVGLEPWINQNGPKCMRGISELAGLETSYELESPTRTSQFIRPRSCVSSSYQCMELDQATEQSSIASESPVTPDDGSYIFPGLRPPVSYDPISPSCSTDRSYHSHGSGPSLVSPVSSSTEYSPHTHEFYLKPIIERSSQDYNLGFDPDIEISGTKHMFDNESLFNHRDNPIARMPLEPLHRFQQDLDNSLDRPPSPEQPSEQYRPDIDDIDSLSQATLLTALTEALQRTYNLSITKICQSNTSASALSFVSSVPNAQVMMKIALIALRKVYLGYLPTTATEVYSLLHLAYAASLVITHENPMLLFNDLFVDVLDWAGAIDSVEDKALFIEVAQHIWLPEVSYAALERHRRHMPIGSSSISGQHHCSTPASYPINGLIPIDDINDQSILITDTETYPSPSAENINAAALLGTLRKGKAVYLCTRYIDVLEYAGLLAIDHGTRLREARGLIHTCLLQSDLMTASVMKDNITEPLLLEIGLEGLIPIIAITEKLLSQGAFRNLRELELKLLYDGMIASRSQEIFEDFLESVSRLCERTCTIIGQDPMYRVSFHTQGIDMIERNCQMQDPMTDQRFGEPEWMAPSNTMSSNNQTDFPIAVRTRRLSAAFESTSALSTTSSLGVSITNRDSPRPKSSLTLDTSSSTIKEPVRKYCPLQPALGSSVKGSPLSLSPDGEVISPDSSRGDQSPDGVQSSLQCERCKQVFTGKKRYLKSNLSRHMKAAHPNKRESLICSFQDCKVQFTRSDNLLTHQRKLHEIAI